MINKVRHNLINNSYKELQKLEAKLTHPDIPEIANY